MARFALVALPLLAGCGANSLSGGEARHVFEALNRVTISLVTQSVTSVLTGGGDASLKVDTHGDDYTLSGRLRPSKWTGDITVDGEVTSDKNELGYTITLGFDQVEMDAGPTLDGDVDFEFWADDSIDLDKLQYSAGIAIDGGLDLSGRDHGPADLAYDVTMEVDGPSVSMKGKGDISGHDVSDWDQLLAVF